MSDEQETPEQKPVYAPIGNYYGTAYARIGKDGQCYIGINDWDGDHGEVEVSREFYDAWVKEFGNAKE